MNLFRPVSQFPYLCLSGKRQAKLGGSSELKVFTMVKGRKPCSRTQSVWWATTGAEAGRGKRTSRSSPRTRFGLVTLLGMASPPDWGEACIAGEDSTECTQRIPRGDGRQRVRKEPSGTWETRCSGRPVRDRRPGPGNHNRVRGWSVESDGSVVAWIGRSSRPGAKGPWSGSSRVRNYWS